MESGKGKQADYPFHHFIQVLKIALLGCFILSSIYAVNQINFSRYFPIRTVKVYGVNHIEKKTMQELLSPMVSRGFFNINVEYIRDRLMQIPWISDIFVRRDWPDQVVITIVEKKPVASWNEQSLLSEAGELFVPQDENNADNLPRFVGPAGKQIVMLQLYTEVNRLLLPLHAKISYFELTMYDAWKLKLNNGITLQIGHKDILTRLDHFVKVYPKIVGERSADVDYVDLRYPNGMAVRWKTPNKT